MKGVRVHPEGAPFDDVHNRPERNTKVEGLMRPRAILKAQVPNPELDTSERSRRFVRAIISVPKAEAEAKLERGGQREDSKSSIGRVNVGKSVR